MTLLATCSYRVAAPPGKAFMPLLEPARCRLLPNARTLSAPGLVAEGSQLWIEQRALGILPIALGFAVTVCAPGRLLEWRMIHGPFSEFSFSITLSEEADGAATELREELRVSCPWWYGGAAGEFWLVRPIVSAFMRLRGNAVNICKV